MKGYRTVAFNVASALIGVAEGVDWISLVGSTHAGWALALVSVANILLRAATTGPLGRA